MDQQERIDAACSFLLQAPPGEINDVLNDVRNIISDDDSLQDGVLPTLKEYNLTQFTVVDVPGTSHQAIISDVARLPGDSEEDGAATERFLDPRSNTSYLFDHITLEASDPQPAEPDPDSETFRSELESATFSYLAAHFRDGVASVFAVPNSPNNFVIQIVANKYNPTNFWSGRWRSKYHIDLNDHTVTGQILVHVHYYEQGNVQLTTSHSVTIDLPPAVVASSPGAFASKTLALIDNEEGNYETSLGEVYQDMGEKTFKGLRRALPLTRQKLDWDKILGYKLGAELSSGKGGFGNS
ncbi:F-actin capping protein, alpha subunit [Fistulina hepatica ATCC 64428]|uniref:F-actin-capping protein subunit alpha n=1 Tax=Fistulina hepatica ATCC 64428 TaxID=1128425 RepID=A0A0D7A1B1_9AGAR|nr:F-actin capping protein, alpha subunit [Fistulina hepatica ATCC 64428]